MGIISFIFQVGKRVHTNYVPTVTKDCMEDLGFGHSCVWFQLVLKPRGLDAGCPTVTWTTWSLEYPGALHSSESPGREVARRQYFFLKAPGETPFHILCGLLLFNKRFSFLILREDTCFLKVHFFWKWFSLHTEGCSSPAQLFNSQSTFKNQDSFCWCCPWSTHMSN